MVHPAAHGLIGHQDPTLSQQILNITEAQGEPDIKPDRLLDDFGREAVAAIAALGHHRWLRLKVTDGKPNGDVKEPLQAVSRPRISSTKPRQAGRSPKSGEARSNRASPSALLRWPRALSIEPVSCATPGLLRVGVMP